MDFVFLTFELKVDLINFSFYFLISVAKAVNFPPNATLATVTCFNDNIFIFFYKRLIMFMISSLTNYLQVFFVVSQCVLFIYFYLSIYILLLLVLNFIALWLEVIPLTLVL